MNEVIIWGASGQAIVLEELLRHQNSKILALFENNPTVVSPFNHIPIFYGEAGFEDWLLDRNNFKIHFLVGIGGTNGVDRCYIFKYLRAKGLLPLSVIHPTAFIAYNSKIGNGCQILAQSTICARVTLGDSVIINSGASVDHESFIDDFVHIAPNATICGSVVIGKYSFIGANATVLPRIRIGDNVIVGAGSVVTRDVPDNVIVLGNPSRILNKK